MEERKTTILAVAGKGGVGKTSVAATMVRLLCQMHPGKRILAIDADPAVGLATALGVEVCLTVDDIRKAVVAQARQGDAKAAVELLGEARCQIFDAVAESRGFAFLAIGRPESAGCYCKVNGYLKEVIGLLAGSFAPWQCHRRRGRCGANQPPGHGKGHPSAADHGCQQEGHPSHPDGEKGGRVSRYSV